MATIIYTANLSPTWKLNFKNLYESKKEEIENTTPVLNNDGIEFIPLDLQVSNGEIESNVQRIYLYIRKKEKKHYMLTTEEYNTYKEQIDVADVVIFINDDTPAQSELESLKKYLHIE